MRTYLVITLSMYFLCFTASTTAQIPVASRARTWPTQVEISDNRVSQIILRAEEHFKLGKHRLKLNQREKAREEFNSSIDSIIESGFDVRANERLQTFYLELVERIYREEVPLVIAASNDGPKNIAGFRDQRFVANRQDELSKPIRSQETKSPRSTSNSGSLAPVGPMPTQLANGQVPAVIRYLNDNLNDPYSMKLLKWSKPRMVYKYDQPFWYVTLRLRAKNGFGAYILREAGFYIKNNKVVFTDNL